MAVVKPKARSAKMGSGKNLLSFTKKRSGKNLAALLEGYHPQANLRGFLEVYARKMSIEAEFESLARIFIAGLDEDDRSSDGGTGAVRPPFRVRSDGHKAAAHCPPVQNLVHQLRARTGEKLDVDAAVTSVRVLCSCLTEGQGTSVSALARRQRALSDFGACAVTVRLVSCQEPRLFACGLQLGMALVRGGNREVQATFLELICTLDREMVAALDGTSWTFFERVREALRLAIKEVPERRTFLRSQADSREQFAGYAEGLSASTVELLRNDLQRSFVTRAHPELLLGFLKELCEGHYVEMQDAMHNQPNTEFDIHVPHEIFRLMAALEPLLDAGNVGQMLQACAALTEMLQGNTSGEVTRALLETKLLALADRLLVKPRTPDSAGDLDVDALHKRSPRWRMELQEAVLTLLHALLEHSDQGTGSTHSEVLDHMQAALDLPSLAALAGRLYDGHSERAMRGKQADARHGEGQPQAAGAGDDKEDSRLAMQAGFQAVLLLRKVTDRSPSLEESTYSCLSPAARSHYMKYVGRVEICNADGLLERVYFRKPRAFQLAAETKQAILWGVDRETPGLAVQQFLLMVPDIHVEVMWREASRSSLLWRLIMRAEQVATVLSIGLAILQNVLIVLDGSVMASAVVLDGHEATSSGTSSGTRALRPSSSSVDAVTNAFDAANSSAYDVAYTHPVQWVEAYSGVRITLGVCQILTCSLAVLVHFGRVTILTLLKLALTSASRSGELLWLGSSGSINKESTVAEVLRHVSHPVQRPLATLRFLSLTLWVSATDMELLIRTCFVVFAALGLAVNERFFVIHLIQVVLANKGLMDVLRAVTQNGRQLMLTSYLLVIVIWFFAVWCVPVELAAGAETACPWHRIPRSHSVLTPCSSQGLAHTREWRARRPERLFA